MQLLKSGQKGISPLIAAVLLTAFTMSVAALSAPFFTETAQNLQQGVEQDSNTVLEASQIRFEVEDVGYNLSTENLSVTVQNKGEKVTNTNVSVGVVGKGVAKNQIQQLTLGKEETVDFQLSIDHTFPLNRLIVDYANYPLRKEKSITCLPTKDMVGYWSFNEEQTTDNWTVDLSKYGHNGSINGGVELSEGMVGESLYFDGSSGEPVVVADSDDLDGFTAFTATLWTYSRQDEQGNYAWFVNKNAFESAPYFMTDEGHGRGNWRVSNGTHPAGHNSVDMNINYREWTMLSQTWNGSNHTSYANAEIQETDTFSLDQLATNNDHLTIGDNGPSNFKGKIDEIRLYKRSLSTAEIQRIYDARTKSWNINTCKLKS